MEQPLPRRRGDRRSPYGGYPPDAMLFCLTGFGSMKELLKSEVGVFILKRKGGDRRWSNLLLPPFVKAGFCLHGRVMTSQHPSPSETIRGRIVAMVEPATAPFRLSRIKPAMGIIASSKETTPADYQQDQCLIPPIIADYCLPPDFFFFCMESDLPTNKNNKM